MTPDARRRVRNFLMFSYLVVAIGGALGSVARVWLSGAVAQKFGETFPAGTLLVNISGCLVIGFFAGLTGPDGRFLVNPTIRQFHDRDLRRLHHLFILQLANPDTGPRRRIPICHAKYRLFRHPLSARSLAR